MALERQVWGALGVGCEGTRELWGGHWGEGGVELMALGAPGSSVPS